MEGGERETTRGVDQTKKGRPGLKKKSAFRFTNLRCFDWRAPGRQVASRQRPHHAPQGCPINLPVALGRGRGDVGGGIAASGGLLICAHTAGARAPGRLFALPASLPLSRFLWLTLLSGSCSRHASRMASETCGGGEVCVRVSGCGRRACAEGAPSSRPPIEKKRAGLRPSSVAHPAGASLFVLSPGRPACQGGLH